jgi:xylulokinase
MLYLGIDNGTQSTKCVVLDLESRGIIASAQQSYGMIEGLPPGHLEQAPELWIEAANAAILACLAKLGERRKAVRAIGVSGQQHGLVTLNDENEPVRPAKLWCDTSTSAQCEQITNEFGGADEIIAMTGNAMLPGYTASKILWLKQNEPSNFDATRTILLPHDYLNFWLTGEKRMEYGDASGTAMFDVRARQWCEPIIEFIDGELAERLPPVKSSRKPVGLLRDALRAEWGLGPNVLVSAGGGDNMMGALGTGNIAPGGSVTASLGTSGTLYGYSPEPVVDEDGEIAAFCDSTDGWLPLACTMNVTVATDQARGLFGWDQAAFETAVQGAAPGAGGLLFLPYLNGERTPNLPRGTGIMHGLTTTNMNPANLARAVMEGATLGLGYGLNRLRSLGVKPTEIRLTGGGSRSAVWRQVCADIFNVPVYCLETSEGAALGAAIQAAWTDHSVQGKSLPFRELTDRLVRPATDTRVEPRADYRQLYQDLQTKQTEMTRKLHNGGFL